MRPVLGEMLDREGALLPVTGVGGSFQLDAPVARDVVASACSRDFCIAKTESAVVSGTSSAAVPAGGAVIAIDGSSAWIYFSATRQFARWRDGTLTPASLDVDGEVLALRGTGAGVQIALRRESGVWIAREDGTIVDSLPWNTSAVLLLAHSTVYSAGEALVVRKADGSEFRFAAAGVTALFAMGEGYVEAMTPQAVYALRVIEGREQLFALPQARVPRRH
jgi:hypothetical protein